VKAAGCLQCTWRFFSLEHLAPPAPAGVIGYSPRSEVSMSNAGTSGGSSPDLLANTCIKKKD